MAIARARTVGRYSGMRTMGRSAQFKLGFWSPVLHSRETPTTNIFRPDGPFSFGVTAAQPLLNTTKLFGQIETMPHIDAATIQAPRDNISSPAAVHLATFR